MHFAARQTATPTVIPFVLLRPDGTEWLFHLSPLPLGFQRRLRTQGIVRPLAPLVVVRDSSGKPMRDSAGLAVMRSNDQDAVFLAELELYHQRVAVLAIAEALRSDPDVRFEHTPPGSDPMQASDWAEYADALHEELAAAGFTDGDLIRLCDEICRQSNLVEDHLTQARRNFSSATTSNTA